MAAAHPVGLASDGGALAGVYYVETAAVYLLCAQVYGGDIPLPAPAVLHPGRGAAASKGRFAHDGL